MATTTTRAKVIGYARVSTEEQAREGVSLDAQAKAIRSYCDLRGLDLLEIVVDEGVSAGKALSTRAGGARVLEAVRKRQVEAVVATKLDRVFRNALDALDVTKGWDRRGIALHFVDMGGQTIDTSSPMGKLFFTMLAAVAECERNMIADRTRTAMAHKADLGQFTGGDAPYGYRVAEDGVNLVEDAQEQEIIREARALREQGLSLRRVAQELARRGHRNRAGRTEWHHQTITNLLAA